MVSVTFPIHIQLFAKILSPPEIYKYKCIHSMYIFYVHIENLQLKNKYKVVKNAKGEMCQLYLILFLKLNYALFNLIASTKDRNFIPRIELSIIDTSHPLNCIFYNFLIFFNC